MRLPSPPNVGQPGLPNIGLPNSPNLPEIVSNVAGDVFRFARLARSGENPVVIDGRPGGNDVVDFTNFEPGVPGAGLVVRAGASGLEFRPAADGPVAALARDVERVVGSGFGDDFQGTGRGVFEGGRGADVLRGLSVDRFVGGDDMDTVDARDSARGLDVDFVLGRIADGVANVQVEGVEQLVLSRLADKFRGGAADETVFDMGGGDVIDGGGGNNTLVYLDNPGAPVRSIVANLVLGAIADGDTGVDLVSNIQTLITGGGNDMIVGRAIADRVLAEKGNDLIVGGRGDDDLDGGDGDDVLIGSDFDAAPGADVDRMSGGAGNDQVYVGNGARAVALGGAGDDLLYGGDGIDWLGFGAGRDIAVGGKGADMFVLFEAIKDGDHAYIADFADGAPGVGDLLMLPAAMQGRVSFQDIGGGMAWVAVQNATGAFGIAVAGVTAAQIADQVAFF